MNHGFTYHDPMAETPEGQLLGIVADLERVVKSKYGNTGCEDDSKEGYKSDRGEGPTPKLPSPKGDKNLKPKKGKKGKKGESKDEGDSKKEKLFDKSVKKNPALMALGGAAATGAGEGFGAGVADAIDRRIPGGKKNQGEEAEGGAGQVPVAKRDATSEFLRERGILVKYEQENSVDNQVPQLMEVSGSEQIRSTVYSTNQRIPHMEDGSKPSPISEVAKMPSVAQTGYDETSSSLHMKLNDGGGFTDNIDQWEEKLTELKKAHPGKVGIIEEIASLTEQVYARL